LSTVYSTTLALNTRHLYYTCHRVSFAQPPSISSPNLVLTLLLPLVVFNMLALTFGIHLPHHLKSTDSYTVLKSNLKTHLFSGASISGLAIFIQALLIRHNHVDFCILKLYYVIQQLFTTINTSQSQTAKKSNTLDKRNFKFCSIYNYSR